MFKGRFPGYVCAVVAAISYGLNPFFGLHLYADGYRPFSVLFFRFLVAGVMLGLVMVLRRRNFAVQKKYIPFIVFEGIMLFLTCLFWFLSFEIMSSGIAATLLYTYPAMIAVILALFFHEKITLNVVAGILLAFAGVACVCKGGRNVISILGIVYVTLSALTYSFYIIAVKKTNLREVPSETLTFYAMVIAAALMFGILKCGKEVQWLNSWSAAGNILGLAFFTSLISFLLLAVAVKIIGETKSAVIGALEPITAVVIGVFAFGEPMSWTILTGICLVLAAVGCVVVKPRSTLR